MFRTRSFVFSFSFPCSASKCGSWRTAASITNSRGSSPLNAFPIPHSPFPIPHSPLPTPHSPFPIPHFHLLSNIHTKNRAQRNLIV
ncbi:hypothetical protein PI95_030075 [Hassallia byssoidea VB512170]|uniref:Uncharacterized protein n=1 Tax=Hassallia byssoidea VB512170 TaxID=1304833 RepID=A0A846HHW0_9CYAN|nr:hypothetical protein [Hassalia byssoidea VB512170]